MVQKKTHQQEGKPPNKGRRNFIKQTSFMTALVAAPPFLVKAAEERWDEKAAGFLKRCH